MFESPPFIYRDGNLFKVPLWDMITGHLINPVFW